MWKGQDVAGSQIGHLNPVNYFFGSVNVLATEVHNWSHLLVYSLGLNCYGKVFKSQQSCQCIISPIPAFPDRGDEP